MSSPNPTAPDPDAIVDGRRARRERGRLATTDALIDLVLEGGTPPTVDQIADRAGVSVASVFRYFDTLEDLRAHAIAHYFDRFAPLFEVPELGNGTLGRRIARFVAARFDQHEATDPMARLTRARAFEVTQFDDAMRRLRATQADQVRVHFADELARLTPAARDAIATIATITSFESWDQYRIDFERSPAQLRRAWTSVIEQALERS